MQTKIIPGTKVKFNGLAPRCFSSKITYTIDKVVTIGKGTIKGVSLGVQNMCKNKDVICVYFKEEAKNNIAYPLRFVSIIK